MSGRHTTVILAAVSVVEAARALDEVSKVVLGIIKPIHGRSAQQSLKVVVIDAGLRIKVRGPNSVQQLYIYTTDPRGTEEVIQRAFQN
jgi:hypothetical protein